MQDLQLRFKIGFRFVFGIVGLTNRSCLHTPSNTMFFFFRICIN